MTVGVSGAGVLGVITDHSYLDGDTFPGLRHELLTRFSDIEVLNLHGSLTRREVAPDAGADENVFDIQQGVTIMVAWVTSKNRRFANLAVSDLWGDRNTKFGVLSADDCRSRRLTWNAVATFDERYLFVANRGDQCTADGEYELYDGVDAIFSQNGKPAPGFLTTHDSFAIAFTEKEIAENVEALLSSRTEGEARESFKLCSQDQWQYRVAKTALQKGGWRQQIRSCLYRPFDRRWTVYNPHVLVHRRERVNSHLLESRNLALLTTRMTKGDDFRHVFVADRITEVICLSSKTSANAFVFPLFLQDDAPMLRGTKAERKANLDPEILGFYRKLAGRIASAQNVFFYFYAVLHSPTYRSRYNARLIREFPRIPRPASSDLFVALAASGEVLVDAHLVRKDASSTLLRGEGDSVVASGMPKFEPTKKRILINSKQYFDQIPSSVWEYKIGSYEVCRKWLSERKGRRLTADDARRFGAIVSAIELSIVEQRKIDKVIEQHGGWPGAFQTCVDKTAATKVVPFRPRTVQPNPADRYKTCVPLVALKAAAGAFGEPQHVEDDVYEWVEVGSRHRLRPGMFVAQVVGRSMEPVIPDGAYCLFRAPVEGTRQGKTVLVQLRDITDPESGERYTVKRYDSEKGEAGDSWRHTKITLKPVNHEFEPIVLTDTNEGELQVIAELVEVLRGEGE